MYETLRKLIVDAELPNANEVFSSLDLTFSVELSPEEGGKRADLVPNGHELPVTPSNVRCYARKYALQRMVVCAKKVLKVTFVMNFFCFSSPVYILFLSYFGPITTCLPPHPPTYLSTYPSI